MQFKDTAGYSSIKKQLILSAQNGEVAHAQLFFGPEGAPNLPLALAYATYLNCEQPTDEDSCGTCASCSKNMKFIHPDLHFVFPVSNTKNVKAKDAISQAFLPDWRRFLTEQPFADLATWTSYYGGEDKQANISREESRQIIRNLSLKSFEGQYKIMLIWLPEYLHRFAANGILKILEEPPEKTLFLLVTNDAEKLLTTILSRTQMVHIPRFSDEDLATMLISRYQFSEEEALKLSRVAEGSLLNALRLSDNTDENTQEIFASWMRSCFKAEFDQLVQQSEDFHRSSKLAQKALLQFTLHILRECLIYQNAPELLKVSPETANFISNFSKVMVADRVEKIAGLVGESMYHLERNGSAKMTYLDLSLSIAQTMKQPA
jgi:DNA polymerase-3 subunit delta'